MLVTRPSMPRSRSLPPSLLACLLCAATACRRDHSANTRPVAVAPPLPPPVPAARVGGPTVVVTTQPLPTAPPPAFPAAPQVSGHGAGGTCEAACRVERESYLRTMCGGDHGAFREMDRECRADAHRAMRECVARCRH